MLKKIVIGIFAGAVTGLFGSGGRDDTCSSFYFFTELRWEKSESNFNSMHTSNGLCKLDFLF